MISVIMAVCPAVWIALAAFSSGCAGKPGLEEARALLEKGDYETAQRAARELRGEGGAFNADAFQIETAALANVEGLDAALKFAGEQPSASVNDPDKKSAPTRKWLNDRSAEFADLLETLNELRPGAPGSAEENAAARLKAAEDKLDRFRSAYGIGLEWDRALFSLAEAEMEFGRAAAALPRLEALEKSRFEPKSAVRRLRGAALAALGRPRDAETALDDCLDSDAPEERAACAVAAAALTRSAPAGGGPDARALLLSAAKDTAGEAGVVRLLLEIGERLSSGSLSANDALEIVAAFRNPAPPPAIEATAFVAALTAAPANGVSPQRAAEAVENLTALAANSKFPKPPGTWVLSALEKDSGAGAASRRIQGLRLETLGGETKRTEAELKGIADLCGKARPADSMRRDCLQLGEALKKRYRLDAAKSLLAALSGTGDPVSCEALKELGWTHWRDKGEEAEARMYDAFIQFLEGDCVDDEEQEILVLRTARRLHRENELERAARMLKKQIDAAPERFESSAMRHRLAVIRRAQGRGGESDALFRETAAADPPHFHTFLLRRDPAYADVKPGSARARPADEASASPAVERALLWRRLRISPLMEEAVDRALADDPSDPIARLLKSQLQAERGDWLNSIRNAESIQKDGLDRRLPETWRPLYAERLFPLQYREQVERQAAAWNVDPAFIFGLIRQESRFMRDITSTSDARGLMQIIPPTGRIIARELDLPGYDDARLWDPDLNIRMGTWYVNYIRERRTGDKPELIYAGYNAGPGRAEKWAKDFGHLPLDAFVDSIPIEQTRVYVEKCLYNYWTYREVLGSSPPGGPPKTTSAR